MFFNHNLGLILGILWVLCLNLVVSAPIKTLQSMWEIGSEIGLDAVVKYGYHRYLPMFLERLRSFPINLLEIGYGEGKSFQLWRKYFPKGTIYSIDKERDDPKQPFMFGNIDQGSRAELATFVRTNKLMRDVDVIIDDGSHYPEHQIVSFKYLFARALKPGGIYIIENIEQNYWRRGESYGITDFPYGRDSYSSVVNIMKGLADVVNRQFAPSGDPFVSAFGMEIDKVVTGVFFGQNCIVVVKTTFDDRDKYFDQGYDQFKSYVELEPATEPTAEPTAEPIATEPIATEPTAAETVEKEL